MEHVPRENLYAHKKTRMSYADEAKETHKGQNKGEKKGLSVVTVLSKPHKKEDRPIVSLHPPQSHCSHCGRNG